MPDAHDYLAISCCADDLDRLFDLYIEIPRMCAQ